MNPMTEWVVPIMAAAVRPCAGIGLALAPAWSVLIAGTDKTLKAAFAKRELIVEDGTAWLWLLIVGLGDALYIVLASLAVVCDETLATEVGRVVDCHSRGQPSPRSFDAPRRRSPYDRPRSLNARSRRPEAHDGLGGAPMVVGNGNAFWATNASEGTQSFLRAPGPHGSTTRPVRD